MNLGQISKSERELLCGFLLLNDAIIAHQDFSMLVSDCHNIRRGFETDLAFVGLLSVVLDLEFVCSFFLAGEENVLYGVFRIDSQAKIHVDVEDAIAGFAFLLEVANLGFAWADNDQV